MQTRDINLNSVNDVSACSILFSLFSLFSFCSSIIFCFGIVRSVLFVWFLFVRSFMLWCSLGLVMVVRLDILDCFNMYIALC